MKHGSILKRYGFAWVTLVLFSASLVLHWLFGWFAYVDEQHGLNHAVEMSGYLHEMLRDTFENWQSEFLQLIWQVLGLALLLHVGSPQSKEGDDRMEAKIDLILQKLDPEARKHLGEIDDKYGGRETDPFFNDRRV
ncbi:MAG: hypothetical protein DYH13_10485 [Alphaproteobacteria bacterium PRO2]|nr:hypothetical protein [Alphaproteobacteria bacterium PRO2]